VTGVAPFTLPAPLQRAVAVVDGDRILVGGGLNASNTSVAEVVTVDPAAGTAASAGQFAVPFHDAAAAMIRGTLYAFGGGRGGNSTDLVQAFDPGTGAGRVVAHMPTALSDDVATASNGAVYIVGGYDGVRAQRSIFATVDGASFELAGILPVGLRYAAVASVGDRLVIAGGETDDGPTSAVEVFDTTTSRVTRLGRLQSRLGHASAFALGGRVYVAGGLNAAERALGTVTIIDPTAGAITSARGLPAAVSDAAVVTLADRAYLVGGWRGAAVSSVLIASLA
jgi:N-acetylneuraminic acid mutarotase